MLLKNATINLMDRYKLRDDISTAEVAFEAYGKTVKNLFINCGYALANIQVDLKTVNFNKKYKFEFGGESIKDLLFNFLDELIYIKDVKGLVFKDFNIDIVKNNSYYITVVGKGERLNSRKHSTKIDVKAVTLHKFSIERVNGKYKATVVLDV